MIKVAVITRTKDRPVFLKRAIESVAAQTYTNYIHVIVNDGGDQREVDKTINTFSKSVVTNIKVYHRDEASNAPDTIFNESIDRVESEYIVLHDDDDTWHCEFLQRTVKQLDSGAQGVLVRTDKIVEKIIDNRNIVQTRVEQYMPDVKAISLYRQCIDNQLTPIAFIYRRDAYKSIGKYDSSLPVAGDWEFGIRFLMRYDITFLDPGFALANYHHRNNGDNSFAKHDHHVYFNLIANKYLRNELSEGKLGPGYIMNQVKHERLFISRTVQKFLPTFVTKRIKRRLDS